MLSTSQWRSGDLPADLLEVLRAERTFVSAGDPSVSTATTTTTTGSLRLVAVTLLVYLIQPFYPWSIFFWLQREFAPSGCFSELTFRVSLRLISRFSSISSCSLRAAEPPLGKKRTTKNVTPQAQVS